MRAWLSIVYLVTAVTPVKRLLAIVLPLLLLMGLTASAQSASAQDEIYVSDAITAAAPAVANGQVLSTESVVLDGQPYRVSEVEISGSPKGDLTGSILVAIPGGELGDGRIAHVSHTAYLFPGELVQLALRETEGIVGAGLAIAVDPALTVYSIVGEDAGAVDLLPEGIGRSQAVGDYVLTGVSWPDFDAPVPYWVNPANSGLGATATINAVQRGFQLLEDDPDSLIDFEFAGTTTKSDYDPFDNQIVVSWVNRPPDQDWIAQAQWATVNGKTVEFDIRLAIAVDWENGAAFNRIDIGTAIGHEVGHGVGLDHSGSDEVPSEPVVPSLANVMYYKASNNLVKPLGPADREALGVLYPVPEMFCAGQLVTINMNYGETPTAGDDVILGTPGDDNIDGRDGDDVICAGAGYDIVHGGHGNDYIEGGRQGDYLYGDQGNDRILGESGNDRLFGDGGDDELFGNSGNDKLYGANGFDLLRGGDGRDTLYGDNDDDKLYGGADDDRLFGESGDDRLWGDDGDDKLNGQNGNDELYGGADSDVISGSRGDDLLDGGSGNDTLDGGSNTDHCDGASGVDTAERCETSTST